MKQQKHDSSRPLYVRILCWILVILMVAGTLYTAAVGIYSLIEASNSSKASKSLLLPNGESVSALLSYEAEVETVTV